MPTVGARVSRTPGDLLLHHPNTLPLHHLFKMDAAIFGLIVADVIAEPMDLRRPPRPGGLAFTNSIQLTTGGNVCNTGIAMAKLGMKVAAAGLVGDDVLGAAVVERLKLSGLDTSAVF